MLGILVALFFAFGLCFCAPRTAFLSINQRQCSSSVSFSFDMAMSCPERVLTKHEDRDVGIVQFSSSGRASTCFVCSMKNEIDRCIISIESGSLLPSIPVVIIGSIPGQSALKASTS